MDKTNKLSIMDIISWVISSFILGIFILLCAGLIHELFFGYEIVIMKNIFIRIIIIVFLGGLGKYFFKELMNKK